MAGKKGMGGGNPNGNPQNLIPGNLRSKEELREMQRKSTEARKKHRMFKDALLDILDTMTDASTGDDYRTSIMKALATKCKNGDVKAIELATKLCGEHVEKVEINGGGPIEINLTGE